jgi:hypothetical protein
MADFEIATKKWGPSAAALKGKTVRRTPAPVKLEEMQIPQHIKELNNQVVLSIDVFFLNGIPLFLMLSHVLYVVTRLKQSTQL